MERPIHATATAAVAATTAMRRRFLRDLRAPCASGSVRATRYRHISSDSIVEHITHYPH
jgi:hypothetical protein